jgi:uncharacterized cupredoxin-like copper-binding protein
MKRTKVRNASSQLKDAAMKSIHLLLAAPLAVASLAASGHGDEGHTHHAGKADGSTHKEQTDWGRPGDAKAARRTISVTMSDAMRFSPAIIEVGEGETVRLLVRNAGKTLHEMVIGTPAEIEEHAAMMRKFPGMEHDEPFMTHVKPDQAGTIVWTFNRPGEFQFACLVAGHYEAGMVGRIRVVAADGHKH